MIYGHREFPAASYDAWKTRSPDDDRDYEAFEFKIRHRLKAGRTGSVQSKRLQSRH